MATELTRQEQENVRAVLRVLKVQHDGLGYVAAKMGITGPSLENLLYGRPIGASTAIRVAKVAGVSVDDVLTGRYPGRLACRHCGHPIDDFSDEETTDAH